MKKKLTARIKILEDVGIKIRNMLVNKNPSQNRNVNRRSVLCVYLMMEKLKSHATQAIYRFNCETCKNKGKVMSYEGETARSARIREAKHIRDLKNKKPNSALFKHKQREHTNEDMNVNIKITQRFKDLLSRQSNEAVRISNRSNIGEIINSKTDFNQPQIARIKLYRSEN